MSESHPGMEARADHYLESFESIVLVLIAVVLAILALLLLGSSVMALVSAVLTGQIRELAIEILDSILFSLNAD